MYVPLINELLQVRLGSDCPARTRIDQCTCNLELELKGKYINDCEYYFSKRYDFLSCTAIGCQSVFQFSKTADSNELKLSGKISLWMQLVLAKKEYASLRLQPFTKNRKKPFRLYYHYTRDIYIT